MSWRAEQVANALTLLGFDQGEVRATIAQARDDESVVSGASFGFDAIAELIAALLAGPSQNVCADASYSGVDVQSTHPEIVDICNDLFDEGSAGSTFSGTIAELLEAGANGEQAGARQRVLSLTPERVGIVVGRGVLGWVSARICNEAGSTEAAVNATALFGQVDLDCLAVERSLPAEKIRMMGAALAGERPAVVAAHVSESASVH